jgi:hypothetical protein
MHRTRLLPASAAAGAAAALSLVATAFAPAANAVEPEVIADGLTSPLSLAVGGPDVYVTQNFVGKLNKVGSGAIYTDTKGREVGGVSTFGPVVTFTTTAQGGTPSARVWAKTGTDGPHRVANTWRYERRHNPDGNVSYGIQGLSSSCEQAIPRKAREGVVAYKGIKESHPYATAMAGLNQTYVADAAGNDILSVTRQGIRTVAVLPPVRVRVTKQLQRQFDLPRCTRGKLFKGEPVPTDVEVGRNGNLYVTTLGGGIGESLPVGAVYRIDPSSGKVRKVERGLRGPVGIAVTPGGARYISQLFGGVISKRAPGGRLRTFASVDAPGDVEYSGGAVYATETDLMNQGPNPNGKVLRWQLR